MDKKGKHLDFVQLTITRMAANSFLIKGWSITIVSALFALTAIESAHYFVWLALFPGFMFWGLDAYFLRQERLFRRLYDEVRLQAEDDIDFSLSTSSLQDQERPWMCVALSGTLLVFHGALILSVLGVYLLLKWSQTNG